MRRMKVVLWASIGIVILLWLQADPHWLQSTNLFQWRSGFVQLSGILAIMLMSLAMLLALRLPLIEQWTQGIDKGYRMHKWLGITSLLLGIFHWMAYQLPKWLVALEWISQPERRNSMGSQASLEGFSLWLNQARPWAMESGEWGLYALLGLMVISLWSAIKYKWFRITHRMMAAIYLLIAFHSLILLKKAYWGTPIYWLTLLVIWVGIWAALYSLFGFVGRQSRYLAHIQTFDYSSKSKTLDLTIGLDKPWQGHKVGQFVYLKFTGEEPHPFTIACANHGSQLRFLIKELGDFTTGLHQRLQPSEVVEVEGPYGKFDFSVDQAQIWIGAGIGITPFMAVLDGLRIEKSQYPIYLFFCCNQATPELCAQLSEQAELAGVCLTIIDSSVTPHLSVADIARCCGDLSGYQFYFCGPVLFSRYLKKALKDYRVDLVHQFHEELFMMR